MKNIPLQRQRTNRTLAFTLTLLAVIIAAALAFGHGGKHSDKFTQLQALQNATKLYDQLIAKGKLDQSWETGLQNVAISKRTHNGKDEIVVTFQRKEGDPMRVYIFFTAAGKYAGSNFTGE
jgi:type II secretory pathway pseudopilin PulG